MALLAKLFFKRSIGTRIIVREIPHSFTRCLRENDATINLHLSREEHEEYVHKLQSNPKVEKIVRIEADEACPDCTFVEDSAVVYGDIALITRSGAPSRRAEAEPVANELRLLGLQTHYMAAPATLDGGDVMISDSDIFVSQNIKSKFSANFFIDQTMSEAGNISCIHVNKINKW